MGTVSKILVAVAMLIARLRARLENVYTQGEYEDNGPMPISQVEILKRFSGRGALLGVPRFV